jgi:hypothetical protein
MHRDVQRFCKELWKAGTPAYLARLKFLPSEHFPTGKTWRDFAKPEATFVTGLQAIEKEAAALDPNNTDAAARWESVLNAFTKDQKRNHPRSLLLIQGARCLTAGVNSGGLLGFAFQMPRRIDDLPVHLEPQLFAQASQLNFDDGTFRAESINFCELRFVKLASAAATINRLKAGLTAHNIPPTPARPQGRPGVTADIIAAFEALDGAGTIDRSKAKARHYRLIRQWLADHCSHIQVGPDTPNSETIRRAITPLWGAKKQ